jgi:hypothetical protein
MTRDCITWRRIVSRSPTTSRPLPSPTGTQASRSRRRQDFPFGSAETRSGTLNSASLTATERKPRLSASEFRFGPIVSSGLASRRTDACSGSAQLRCLAGAAVGRGVARKQVCGPLSAQRLARDSSSASSGGGAACDREGRSCWSSDPLARGEGSLASAGWRSRSVDQDGRI